MACLLAFSEGFPTPLLMCAGDFFSLCSLDLYLKMKTSQDLLLFLSGTVDFLSAPFHFKSGWGLDAERNPPLRETARYGTVLATMLQIKPSLGVTALPECHRQHFSILEGHCGYPMSLPSATSQKRFGSPNPFS